MIGAVNRLGVEVRRGLSQFAVGSKEPSLGFDFIDNTYLADGTKNLSQALTHSRSGNATMTDSDGNIKWAPHNLLTYSEDFSAADWDKVTTTITANAAVAPDGATTADKVTVNSASISFVRDFLSIDAYTHTFGVFAKAGTTSSIQL